MRVTRIVGDGMIKAPVDPIELFSLRVFRWGEVDLIEQLKKASHHGKLCPLIQDLLARQVLPGFSDKNDYLISDKAV